MALRNRVALVTGASRGIGKEIALSLGRAGLRVAVAFRTKRLGAQKVFADLRAVGAEGLALATDVTDPARVKELDRGRHQTIRQAGRPGEQRRRF